MARKDISDEAIVESIKSVRLSDLLERKGGLDYVLREEAGDLSGGERQRLALAIALLADRDIYLFDEATSNIDSDSERIIMERIASLKGKGKTILLISHRLSNVVYSDRIYFLKDGRITEEGTHSVLMEQEGEYASLYRTQKRLSEGPFSLAEVQA